MKKMTNIALKKGENSGLETKIFYNMINHYAKTYIGWVINI